MTNILLPMTATISSSKTRHGGRHTSLSLRTGGFSLGWLDLYSEKYSKVQDLLSGAQDRTSGQSGSKYTMDPKYSWAGYNLPPEKADVVMKAVFGTSVVDELNRVLSQKPWVIFKDAYCLPRENLNRFIATRCRDRTWCNAVRFKEESKELVSYLRDMDHECDDEDVFGAALKLHPPKPPARERVIWRCDDCGHQGHREHFTERTLPGLAGPTGLNCPKCDFKHVSGIAGLLQGPTRGEVNMLPASILYPGY
ncbi:hypothetical protein G6L74_06130 [Agrobacterium tumefaciens]|uniref:hypothetical protein n=1 Tax=Agrobacterium tumefaciens TaxID=358 RepID=UPI0015748532|nr:hypothetical protein [Agrobacterium tumefaciens]